MRQVTTRNLIGPKLLLVMKMKGRIVIAAVLLLDRVHPVAVAFHPAKSPLVVSLLFLLRGQLMVVALPLIGHHLVYVALLPVKKSRLAVAKISVLIPLLAVRLR